MISCFLYFIQQVAKIKIIGSIDVSGSQGNKRLQQVREQSFAFFWHCEQIQKNKYKGSFS
jgi:hypothetical protein